MIKEMIQVVENTKNFSTTENGAVGYKTTGSKLVDLNFRIPSMRGGLSNQDIQDFILALNENLEYAVKWMFYVRDVRGGLGERDTFIHLFKIFYGNHRPQAINCISLIAEYGRWKDLVELSFTDNGYLNDDCMSIIGEQLKKDIYDFINDKPISLLAKWLPSINASQKSRCKARKIANYLDMPFCDYRKMLAKLRKYLDVTEVKTCANQWNEIDYNKVSSNANLKYKGAFMKHDYERYSHYILELNEPKENSNVKMNASVLYPHEIWSKYTKDRQLFSWNIRSGEKLITEVDYAFEAMWKNLKDMKSCGNTMCIVDGSGSMISGINGVHPINVSRSLGVYFAERCTGEFHNMMIEFSSEPKIIDINHCETLADKINHISTFIDASNTDIEKTFMLILDTAVKNHMTQADMPERLLVISDMEFDCATTYRGDYKTLFDTIKERFEKYGYKMPKLIFWNVNSRTNTIPVKENELGVILVSGYSVNIINMVMSGQADPWLALKETLDNKRYSIISDKLNNI